jgi:hypothetical protein
MTALVTIFVPPAFHGTVFEEVATINGNRIPQKYQPRDHNGHIVVDVPFGFFQRVLAGEKGKDWLDANPEAMAWLGEADRRTMTSNAFPGADRAPPVAPSAPAAPVMVRMLAPKDVTGCSVQGVELTLDADRAVTVTDAVADTLRSFGFTPA